MSAALYAHGSMTAPQAIDVARRHGLLLVHLPTTGNYVYEFPLVPTDIVGGELAGTRGCGKAGFANCDMRTPGINSQRQNGVTDRRDGQPFESSPQVPVPARIGDCSPSVLNPAAGLTQEHA